ncbi:hypothetical protein MYP_4950 [Sporocytophaga myxococcoides]|uniref:Uncharacterized protein n=1 Tax=Sporocytophaga myxococcoides TaxID=153721 RepID=A0A098LMG5_9BACT|nr:hypothetical protein [Sporocytophaga myxococcoides]GAL87719.1 hypothetical protein MYP_4950 [Sporocytophaga myxococcoides]
MKSYISIFLIISCIAVISCKDTLRSMHSLLHQIPNPFHSHSHTHIHLHHGSDQSSKGYDYQYSIEGHHHHTDSIDNYNELKKACDDTKDHDVLEHFGLEDQKDETSPPNRKRGDKKIFKIQWYPGVCYQYDFDIIGNVNGNYLSGNNNFFLTYLQIPPSPPPEFILL